LLHSWLDRLLVLLVVTTLVLTLFALQYVGPSSPPAVQSEPPAQAPRPAPPALDRGAAFAQTGMNAMEAGDAAAAIRWFERAAQASPGNPEWRRRLADAFRMSGDLVRASEEALRATELEASAAEATPPARN
jgi:hypothetical protein